MPRHDPPRSRPEHQPRLLAGAAILGRIETEAAVIAVDARRQRLGEAHLRVPHQRAVGEDPDRLVPRATPRPSRHRVDRVDRDIGVSDSHRSLRGEDGYPGEPGHMRREIASHALALTTESLSRPRPACGIGRSAKSASAERPVGGDPGHVEQHHPLPRVLADMPGRALHAPRAASAGRNRFRPSPAPACPASSPTRSRPWPCTRLPYSASAAVEAISSGSCTSPGSAWLKNLPPATSMNASQMRNMWCASRA